MVHSVGQKRKAGGQSKAPGKRIRHPSPQPSQNESVEDFGDGAATDEDEGEGGIYHDPMIDPQDSSDLDSDAEEAEDEDEEEEDAIPTAGPSRPTASAPSKGLYKAPTLAELDTLRQAEMSGGTNFSLQLDALLSSTLMSTTPPPALKSLLSSLHSHILSLPTLPPLSPQKAINRVKDEGDFAFSGPEEFNPLHGEEVKWGLGWEKPEEIFVGGSWGITGGYKRNKGEMGSIDLVVILPAGLFSAKDRMSYRYFHKRNYYLAVIKSALRKLAEKEGSAIHGCELAWGSTGDDERRKGIIVTAGKEQGLKHQVEIRIHAGIPPTLFAASSLSPSKSLLRHSSLQPDVPTPLYSTSILHDTLYKSHLLNLHRLFQSCSIPRTVDSFLALWRIWANRRGIQRERGGSGWFAGLILGWVVNGGEIGERGKGKKVRGLGKSLGHWSALRAAWEFIAHTDFAKTPAFISSNGDQAIPQSEFLKSFQDILVDSTSTINVFAGWNKGDIEILRHHARETLAMLEDAAIDRFSDVFLKDHALGSFQYDEHIQIDISSTTWQGDLHTRSEHSSRAHVFSSTIASIIRRGLADRAAIVHVYPISDDLLSVGLIYNTSNATRVLDIGASSDQPEAAKAFRELWGDKAELRRFKDGSIAESVVWDLTRPEDAALIPSRIVKWLVSRHFSISDDDVTSFTSQPSWLSILQNPASARNAVSVAGSERLGFRPIMDAYDDLYKLLKSIDSELPLAILQVQPATDILRYGSTFVPHPIDLDRFANSPDCLKWFPAADIILQFESSPRWPDDLAAIQKVKLALFEKVARVIKTQRKGATAEIVFDTGRTDIEDSAALEVVAKAGSAFRIRIYHEKERVLLERVLEDDTPTYGTSLPQPPRRLAIPALVHHLRQFVHLPQHHSAIAPLHHRFTSYSSATRLFKRWFAAHMLSVLVDSNAIELIMAKIYLEPGTIQPPNSAVSGFVRAIKLLSEWDWKSEPLVLPLSSSAGSSVSGRIRFPEEKREVVSRLFAERRKKDMQEIHQTWVIATEEDLAGTRWTEGVGRVIAGRVRGLAKATLTAIQHATNGGGLLDVQALFITPTDDYDVLIHLHPSLITRYAQAVAADPNEWEAKLQHRNIQQTGVYGEDTLVGFNPAETLAKDIQKLYGESILVFYDVHGGSLIGLLWNPTKSQPRALKPFLGYSTKPAPGSAALVEINKQSVLGEVARLGKGLIERVEVLRA